MNALTIAIQVNGKLKNTININKSEKDKKELIIAKVKEIDNISDLLANKKPKKIIFIPGKVVNIVI